MERSPDGRSSYLMRLKASGVELKVRLSRHRSPITVERLYRILPTSGLAVVRESCVYVFLNLKSKLEKPVRRLSRGEVAFAPSESALVLALEDTALNTPASPIGTVDGNPADLSRLRTGETIELSRCS